MRKTKRNIYHVKYYGGGRHIEATSVGNAARKAFKEMINEGLIKCQPKSERDGTFNRFSIGLSDG